MHIEFISVIALKGLNKIAQGQARMAATLGKRATTISYSPKGIHKSYVALCIPYRELGSLGIPAQGGVTALPLLTLGYFVLPLWGDMDKLHTE